VASYIPSFTHALSEYACISLLDWEHRISLLELEINVTSNFNVTSRALIQSPYKGTITLTRTWWSSYIDGLTCIRGRQFKRPGLRVLINISNPHPTILRPFHNASTHVYDPFSIVAKSIVKIFALGWQGWIIVGKLSLKWSLGSGKKKTSTRRMHSSLYIHTKNRLLAMMLIYSLIETRQGRRIISTYHPHTNVDPKVPPSYFTP